MSLEITDELFALVPDLTVRGMVVIYLKRRIYKISKEEVPALEKEKNSLEHHKSMVIKFDVYKYYDEQGNQLSVGDMDNLILRIRNKISSLELLRKKMKVYLEELLKRKTEKEMSDG